MTGILFNATFEDEVKLSLENIKLILQATNLCIEDVLKIKVYIIDINLFNMLNEVHLTFFPKKTSIRLAVKVSKFAKGTRVEIETIDFRD